MKISWLTLVLSLLLLGAGNWPAQGSALRALKGSVGNATARLLPKVGQHALTFAVGATLMLAPLANVDATGGGAQDRPVVQDQSNVPKEGIIWEAFDADLKAILDEAERAISNSKAPPASKASPAFEKALREFDIDAVLDEAEHKVNLQLGNRAAAFSEHLNALSEYLNALSALETMNTLEARSAFKRGAGVSSRLQRLFEQRRLIDSGDFSAELREEFLHERWLDLVASELILAAHWLKDANAPDKRLLLNKLSNKSTHSVFSPATLGGIVASMAKEYKSNVDQRQRLFGKLLRGDISKEDYEQADQGIWKKFGEKLTVSIRRAKARQAGTSRNRR